MRANRFGQKCRHTTTHQNIQIPKKKNQNCHLTQGCSREDYNHHHIALWQMFLGNSSRSDITIDLSAVSFHRRHLQWSWGGHNNADGNKWWRKNNLNTIALHSEFKSGKKYNFSDYRKFCPQRIKAIFLNFFFRLGVSRSKAQFCIQKYWENFLSTNMLILIFVVITNTVFFECLKSSSSLNYHNKCNKLVKVP